MKSRNYGIIKCSVVVVMATMFQFGQVLCASLQDAKNLYTDLFLYQGYNKFIRPIANQDHVLDVYTAYTISAVISFDEQAESLTTSGFLTMGWTDNGLQWNTSQYGGLTQIFVPQDEVWKPDVSLRNSYMSFEGLGSTYLNVWVYSHGYVNWTPFQLLTSVCNVDITYFPFDTQTCHLKFNAWSYNTFYVTLSAQDGDKVTLSPGEFEQNSQWTLVDSSVSVSGLDSSVTFTLKLERKSLYYVVTIIVPVMLLSALNVMVFLLPVKSGERASFAVTVFLSMAVFLTIVASEFPKNSNVISNLAVYLLTMISLSTLTVMITVAELRLAARDEDEENREVPKICRSFVSATRMPWFQCRKQNRTRVGSQPVIKDLESDLSDAVKSEPRRNSADLQSSNIETVNIETRKTSTDLNPVLENTAFTPEETESTRKSDSVLQDRASESNITWDHVVKSLDCVFFSISTLVTVIVTAVFFGQTVSNPQSTKNYYDPTENLVYG